MSGFSKVILVGNVAREPEARSVRDGKSVADFCVAINTPRGKDDDGSRREDVVFIDITAWGRLADLVVEYFPKGKPVLIEGQLKQDSWEDRSTGVKRSKIKVVADRVAFLPRNDGGSADLPSPGSRQPSRQRVAPIDEPIDNIPF